MGEPLGADIRLRQVHEAGVFRPVVYIYYASHMAALDAATGEVYWFRSTVLH